MKLTLEEAINTLFTEYPDVVTVDQLSEMISLNKKSTYDLLRSKVIGSIKYGKVYRIPKIYVFEFLEIIER